MKIVVLTAALLSGLCGYVIAQNQSASPAQHVLDLTMPGAVRTAPQLNAGGSKWREGLVRKTPPLRISLVSVDRSEWTFGEAFVYEVEVTNTGRSPVDFPGRPIAPRWKSPARRRDKP